MEINLKLDSQQKISALGELLLIAAKSPQVNEMGMKVALDLLEDLRVAVASYNETHGDEQKEAA